MAVCPGGRLESAGLSRYPDGGVLEPPALLGGQGSRQRGAHLRPPDRRRRDPDRLAELAGGAGRIQTAVRYRFVRRAEPSHVPHLHPQSPAAGRPGFVYHAGEHFNVNATWWDQAGPLIEYMSAAVTCFSRAFSRPTWPSTTGTRRRTSCPRGGSIPTSSPSIRIRPACTAASPGQSRPPRWTKGMTTTTSTPKSSWRGCGSRTDGSSCPTGLSYALLVLAGPGGHAARGPPEARRAGRSRGNGRRPQAHPGPGTGRYPACDLEVKVLANEIWGACDGAAVKERAYGKGRIVWGIPLNDLLRDRGLGPTSGLSISSTPISTSITSIAPRPRGYLLRLQQRQGTGDLRRRLSGGGGPDAGVLDAAAERSSRAGRSPGSRAAAGLRWSCRPTAPSSSSSARSRRRRPCCPRSL